MGWQIAYDSYWRRDIGYGVPAICDYPGCGESIDRGLGHVCGGEPYGGEEGCGLFFCGHHLAYSPNTDHHAYIPICERCYENADPFNPTPDTDEWVQHKLTDPSWAEWRQTREGQKLIGERA